MMLLCPISDELKTSLIKAAKRKISAKENQSLSDEPVILFLLKF